MAKIKFGMFMTDARGKVGGTVFSKNRSGAYTRNKVTPSNPQTSAQSLVRSRLSALAQGFRGLTLAQIAAWNAAVEDFQTTNVFGDSVRKTGLNLYVGLNSTLEAIGQSTISDPPVPTEVPFATIEVSDPAAAALEVDLSAIPSGNSYLIEATKPVSPGVNNVNNLYRLIAVASGTGAAITGLSLLADYTAKYGAPQAGQKIGFRVKTAVDATGQAGIPASVLFVVA